MAQQEYYLGSVGPLLYDDTETYPDTVGRVAVRGVQMYVSDAPYIDNHVLRLCDVPENASGGWVVDTDTWVYVSATSFKIDGKDVTSRFPVGCKLKLTQTSAKYFYVVSAAFSTDTTVTVTGGSDYTLANAAITSPCYSYQSCPAGFPQWFNFTETWTGFSTAPSGGTVRFRVEGRHVFMGVNRTTAGTSNANTCTISIPINATSLSGYIVRFFGIATDNGTQYAYNARGYILAGGSSAILLIANSTTAWTNSGYKDWYGTIDYEI